MYMYIVYDCNNDNYYYYYYYYYIYIYISTNGQALLKVFRSRPARGRRTSYRAVPNHVYFVTLY